MNRVKTSSRLCGETVAVSFNQYFFLFPPPLFYLNFTLAGLGEAQIFFKKYDLKFIFSFCKLRTTVFIVVFETLIRIFSNADIQVAERVFKHVDEMHRRNLYHSPFDSSLRSLLRALDSATQKPPQVGWFASRGGLPRVRPFMAESSGGAGN